MKYVDGFVLPVPKNKVAEYKKIAQLAGKIWREHGALEYRECVGEEMVIKKNFMGLQQFPKVIGAKPTETVFFSWIVFKSKAHRNQVNAKVMKDKRMCEDMAKEMPFDCKRMAYGGFESIVDL